MNNRALMPSGPSALPGRTFPSSISDGVLNGEHGWPPSGCEGLPVTAQAEIRQRTESALDCALDCELEAMKFSKI